MNLEMGWIEDEKQESSDREAQLETQTLNNVVPG